MLSNFRIDRYYSHEPRYGGCMAQSSLKKAQNGKFYILNLDRPSGPGTHWVLLSMLSNKPVYFNSFGFGPDEPIIKAVGRKKIQYSDVDIQPISSEDCGYYCIAIANELLSGRSFKQALEKFHIKYLNKNNKIAIKLSKKKRKASIGSGIPIELF